MKNLLNMKKKNKICYKSENEEKYEKNFLFDINNEESQERSFILNKYENEEYFNADNNTNNSYNDDELHNYINWDLNSELKDNNDINDNKSFGSFNNYFPGFSFSTFDEDEVEDECKFNI